MLSLFIKGTVECCTSVTVVGAVSDLFSLSAECVNVSQSVCILKGSSLFDIFQYFLSHRAFSCALTRKTSVMRLAKVPACVFVLSLLEVLY